MKLYLAAMYALKDEIRVHAKTLRQAGHEITSGWLRERTDADTDLYDVSDRFCREHAEQDLQNIDEAQGLVLFTVEPIVPTKRGGRHVEFGYALAKRKKLFIVGPRENIFHFDPAVTVVESVAELMEVLNGRN